MHNVLGVCISITRASGRGLGHGYREFLDPGKWHRVEWRVSFGAPKNSGFPGPNPLPLAQVRDMHESKTLCTGLYKSEVVLCTRDHGEGGGVSGPILWRWRSRCIKDLITLLGPLRCIKELNRPARAAPPITKLTRNQEGWVAKSVARQLATAVLWVRIQTSLKNQKSKIKNQKWAT